MIPESREFHLSRAAREKYSVDDTIISLTGAAMVVEMDAARQLARSLQSAGRQVSAADLLAMGLIDEIQHLLLLEHSRKKNDNLLAAAAEHLRAILGEDSYVATLKEFARNFPTVALHKGTITLEEYFRGKTDETLNEHILLEEMLMLWLENRNPAFSPYRDLFDESLLDSMGVSYRQLMTHFSQFLDGEPGTVAKGSLLKVLQAPAMAHPDSLAEQLRFIEEIFLPQIPALQHLVVRILHGRDFIVEEKKSLGAWFSEGFQGMATPEFSAQEIRASIRAGWGDGDVGGMSAEDKAKAMFYPEYEAYTSDREWMPQLVLMAKNAYVWLDQLARQYKRDIYHLDHVPDEELDQLREWGITGLWLIGLWERSVASRTIKQRMGAQDAVASAYSLMDYTIAQDLGGQEAMNRLAHRAWLRGIRMGSDMVPNHFGIDSTWVLHHPDRFLSLDHPPYPGYTFHGPDLSPHAGVGIFLEDHYYNHSDAAVVFKRVDYRSGETRYIYHGNDGTTMPWNDTAQLDYSKKYVREVVIQTILHVCRQFPIVRFDAAMTLAKRHVQRLWFPLPGSGDGIPSRAGRGMTREEFDRLHPQEFWREVVDRAAVEAPDCLLLAEAFWMLEGYFVRTLGMHRVYNSAFMHMLRDEDNAKYRYLIKETLEFDPQILQRYVNFMNNPDEKTAVEQFGKGDKYFGITIMLATIPGLPMIGHGQVEGYGEKYGMEYRRAKWDEKPDFGLIAHHARVVFPVLHKRYLFSAVENFYLYDCIAPEGHVNENVFAYSNRCGDEMALVIYHNRHADTSGYIRQSVGYLVKGQGIHRRSLADSLGLQGGENEFLIMRDHISGYEFIRSGRQICQEGWFVSLGKYQCQLLWQMRIVHDTDGTYARVHHELAGRGAESVEMLRQEQINAPVIFALRESLRLTWEDDSTAYLAAVTNFYERIDSPVKTVLEVHSSLFARAFQWEKILPKEQQSVVVILKLAPILLPCLALARDHKILDHYSLRRPLLQALGQYGIAYEEAAQILIEMQDLAKNPIETLEELFTSDVGKKMIGANVWEEIEYFSRDAFYRVSTIVALLSPVEIDLLAWWQMADDGAYQLAKMVQSDELQAVDSDETDSIDEALMKQDETLGL